VSNKEYVKLRGNPGHAVFQHLFWSYVTSHYYSDINGGKLICINALHWDQTQDDRLVSNTLHSLQTMTTWKSTFINNTPRGLKNRNHVDSGDVWFDVYFHQQNVIIYNDQQFRPHCPLYQLLPKLDIIVQHQ